MPWLKKNRNQEKFESIIRLAGPAFHNGYGAFFPSIVQTFKKLQIAASNKFITELAYFSTLRASSPGKKMTLAFINQPVKNYRAHFYNVLTGMSLGAYHDWLEQFFRQCEGPETKSFYLEKTLADLHAMIVHPLPEKMENEEEEKIVIQVKLALTILLQHLVKRHGASENNMLLYFDIRGWLKESMQQMHFKEQADQLLMLFDQLTEERKPNRGNQPVLSEIKPEVKDKEQDLNFQDLIPDVLKEVQQDLSEVKHAVENFISNKQLQNKSNEPAEKWLTSKEVCEILRIGKSTLKRKRDAKKIEFSRLGNKIRYEENYIRQMMRESRGKGTQ